MNASPDAPSRDRKRELLLLKLRQSAAVRSDVLASASIPHCDRSQALPLSFAQQRLWFVDQLDHAAGAAYHMPAALRLQGALDRAALQATLDRIVARHESLRTRFIDRDGTPQQVIDPVDRGLRLHEQDLSALSAEQQRASIAAISQQEVAQLFDLAQGPLIRGRLLRLAADDHVLLLTQHHIITDGWSIGVLIQEVSTLYTAFCAGRADPLPALPLQYADYAVWQREALQGEALARQTAFWKSYLGGAPALMALPSDRPRPPQQSYAGGNLMITVPADLSAALRGLSQRHGSTLFMTLLSGWSILLARLSGEYDLVIGTPVANRPRRELEGLIGFFANTLALRLRLTPELSVAEALAAARQSTLAAYDHQQLPFDQVVEALQPQRSLSHSPLFQVMLSITNTPGSSALELPGLQLSAIEQAQTSAQFDLSLSLTDQGEEIVGSLQYASDLFDRSSVALIGERLLRVLAAMVADETQSIAALPLLTAAERCALLQQFDAPRMAVPSDALLHTLFQQQAERSPAAIALQYGEQQLSYAQLEARANQLAHRLRAAGVGPDVRVGLCLERGLDQLVGVLAILKAGGAYLPLDPTYPSQRLQWLLQDAQPQLLLAERATSTQFAASALPILHLDDRATSAGQPTDAPVVAELRPDHLAYVIYTSGSTGEPKGVMIEHRSVINLWSTLSREVYSELSANARIGLNAALSFDASLQGLTQLLSGRCLVIVPQEVRRDSAALARFVDAQALEAFDGTPAQLAALFEAEPNWRPTALRAVLIGGEAISPALWSRLADWDGVSCWNVYGPTECTVDSTATRIQGSEPHIGWPMANVPVRILDARGEPVPVGVTGELYIGGVQVARGYLHREALSAERFLADPFAAAPARMYRSGDLGRWRRDGSIDYLGRNDQQVKIRGVRIELGEIESQLCRLPAVREAAVLAREDQPGDRRLVAYLVFAGEPLEAAELRRQLATQLPEALLPSAYVTLTGLPMTANGKLDRAALPAPGGDALAQRTYVAPMGSTERSVAAIWQSLLGVAQVGRDDHFFELGGHSLLAVKLISQLRESLGVELSLRQLFAQPVLADFAGLAEHARRSVQTAIPLADRSAPLPLSHAQQRMWFVNRLDSASGLAYHLPLALRIDGALDRAALQATLDRIVARHEGLRTTFVDVDGNPRQRIDRADCGFTLLQHDLSGLQDDMQAAVLARVMEGELSAPFDLAQGPLIRGRLLCLNAQAHVLLITQHHIITDGWSINLLMQEVSALYEAFCRGLPDPLPPLSLQYADYAAWQRGWLQGEQLREQTEFWKRYLQGVPTLLNLPADRPRPAKRNYAGASLGARLSPRLTAQLKALSQRHGSTLFMTMLAGWSVLLARISGQDDLVIGTPVANRQRKDLEPLIGFFVNTLALRVNLDGDPSFAELLRTIRRDTLQAFEHQDLPFEQVVEAVQPVRSMAHSPLFQVILNWETAQDDSALSMQGLQLRALEQSHSTTPYDLTLFLKDIGDEILCSWRYTTDLFDAASIERLIGQFECLLGELVEREDTPVSRLRLLDDAQRQQVLHDFNRPATAEPEALIHLEFERQVALQPQATAVVAEDGELSFAQLNQRANQVAHALRARGLQPDDIVGLSVERSVEMLVGLLGILKAGGAYLPLDPALPAERIAHMLRDSRAVVVLAQPRSVGSLPELAIPRLLLGAHSADLRGQPDTNPDPLAIGLHPRHLAYVIYTSGSTGAAKGVMVEHRSPVNFWRVMERTTHRHCSPKGRVALNASFSFDMSLKGILQLLSGRCLVLIPQTIRADGGAMLRFLAAHRIEAFDCTPSQLSVLIAAGLLTSERYKPRSVLIGGEAIDADLWRRLRAAEGIHFYNMYGPTECTVDATLGDLDALGELPSIGWPLDNLCVRILDRHGEPVPIGVAGELHLGGIGVARGYLHRPELTAERFVADAHDPRPGARVYRSGDLGRWRADGSIEYLGRNDFQVKIRGYRIELGEIEAALKACPGVREAAVIAREDQPGDQRLVAYLTSVDGTTLDVATLRARLSSQLADYMLPSAYVTLPMLPLNNNGKLDRPALPAPDASAVASQPFAAPQGEWETAVAAIWAELLELDQIGRDDNFFELGGHSLLGVLLLSRLRQDYELDVALRELFVHPTLRGFAAAIGTTGQGAGYRNLVPIRTEGSALPLFLIHPSEGEVGYARTLAEVLAADLPVYALAATGLAEGELPLASVEEMASQYLREIRQVQPEGPYRIAGWSAGGTIAYEIAHQLIGADQRVEFLGLIDTAGDYRALHQLRTGQAAPAQAERDFDGWICSLDWLPLEHAAALRPQLEALASAGRVEALLACAQRLGELPADLDPALLRRHLALRYAMGDALLSYVRPPLPIAFTLFSALDEDRRQRPIGWTAETAHRRIDVPGTHFSLVQPPQVQILADALNNELRRSSGRAPALQEYRYSPMITIQSGRAAVRPLFCVPGAGASVAAFAGLAQAMDASIPIYGLQPRGLCGQLVPHIDVLSTVRAYIEAIRTVAPRGPYRLLGHSYGGWVAAEMARQLEAEGEQVETLVVLDSMPPPSMNTPFRRLSRVEVLARLVEIYELTLHRPLGLSAADFAPLGPDQQLALLLARLIEAKLMHRGAGIETMRGIVQVFATNINTYYLPEGSFAGTLHLVKVPELPRGELQGVSRLDDHHCDWREFAADIRYWEAPGNHMTMLSAPHVDRLASWLRPLLGGVQ